MEHVLGNSEQVDTQDLHRSMASLFEAVGAANKNPEDVASSQMELQRHDDEEVGPGTKREIFMCQDFCVKCKATGHVWRVQRATTAVRKISVGLLTVGALSLAAAGLTGIVASGGTA